MRERIVACGDPSERTPSFCVCRTQILALSTGKPLEVLSDEMVAAVQAPAERESHSSEERDRLFFEAMMRVLDREMPGYRR